jgi:TolB-like protein/DNA-binding winged helix-turn-helix (wHTH) protein
MRMVSVYPHQFFFLYINRLEAVTSPTDRISIKDQNALRMDSLRRQIYEFAGFRLDVASQSLFAPDGRAVQLPSRSFDALHYLVARAGEVVERRDLFRAIWPKTVVEENNLNQCIMALRKVLGEEAGERRFILTVPGRGYKFVAPTQIGGTETPVTDLDASHQPAPRTTLTGRRILLIAAAVATISVGSLVYWRSHALRDGSDGSPQLQAMATRENPINLISDRSIAVLPFLDLTLTKNEGFFADGMTEELTSMLSQVPDLRVTARTSAFYFKDRAVPVGNIGKILGVSHVLEGSVREAGDRLRITVQLIRTTTGFHEWAQDYDRNPADLLAVQTEVARTVAEKLQASLESVPAFHNKLSSNSAARDALMAASQEFAKHTNAGNANGVDLLKRATQLDPNFALAWSVLSYGYVVSTASGVAWRELRPKALFAARRALEIDPMMSDGHVALGQVLLADWNISAASTEANRALELEPHEYHALRLAALLQVSAGDCAKAIGVFQELIRREPINYFNYYDLGNALWADGQLTPARQALETALALNPASEHARARLALVTLEAGDPNSAYELVKQGHPDEEQRILQPLIRDAMGEHVQAAQEQAIAEQRYGSEYPYDIAAYYARRGSPEQAMRWLDRSYERHDPGLIQVGSDPLFKPLRADPHFMAFLGKLKSAGN